MVTGVGASEAVGATVHLAAVVTGVTIDAIDDELDPGLGPGFNVPSVLTGARGFDALGLWGETMDRKKASTHS
eukprot:2335347-Rhodomonas_salina.2